MSTKYAMAWMLGCALDCANALEIRFLDDGEYALLAAERAGIGEAPVPVFHNGVMVGPSGSLFNTVETYDRVPGTSSYPLTAVNLVSNFYYRLTDQQADGGSAPLGTSVVATPSYRTDGGLAFIPLATRADVTSGPMLEQRYRVTTQGNFASAAQVTSSTAFADPVVGESTASLAVRFLAPEAIALASGQPFVGNDRFRLLTLSSMFSSPTVFDANLLRYERADGAIGTLRLSDVSARDAHLFAEPVDIGSWFELVKTPGSTWFPDSPSLRISILDDAGLRLGLQGFLASTRDPSDDSLSVWLEWKDAPDLIGAGTDFTARYTVSAYVAPQPLPEPSTYLTMLLAGGLWLTTRRRTKRAAPSGADENPRGSGE